MKPAPNFSLPDQDGKIRTLADYAGKWLVLYFYPKDNTPGCTKEACNFRDARDAIADYGHAVVVGISKDSVESHKKFIADHELNFTLLSDADHKTMEDYGVWGPKKYMGKEYIGVSRNTYIINPKGQIVKTYEGVDPKSHAAEIMKELETLQGVKP